MLAEYWVLNILQKNNTTYHTRPIKYFWIWQPQSLGPVFNQASIFASR